MEHLDCEKLGALTTALESAIVYRLATGDPRAMNAAQYDLDRELSRTALGGKVVSDSLADFPDKGAPEVYAQMCVRSRTLIAGYQMFGGAAA